MKTYGQFCPLASALDLVGERWTLLIVRELLFLGPRRFTDLQAGLPGLAPNLLSARLRGLEQAGLVERATLPAPAGSNVYRLTGDGRDLREPILALMRWGNRHLPRLSEDDAVRPELALMALEAGFQADRAAGLQASYEVVVDGTAFTLAIDDGALELRPGPATDPAVRVRADLRTIAQIATGQTDVGTALASGRLEVEGDAGDVERLGRLLGLLPPG